MKPIGQWTTADIIDFCRKVDKKTWLKTGAAAAAGLLIFVFVIWPAWFTRVSVRGQISALESQIALSQALMKKKPEWLRQKEEYAKFIQNAKQRIYQRRETSLLLGAISKLATESRVGIVASQPKDFEGKLPAPFDQQYQAELYELTLEGSYHDLGSFIDRIESNPKFLRVQSFHISTHPESSEPYTTEVALSVVSSKEGAA